MIDSFTNIAASVIAFYFVVGCNFIPEIIGCRLQTLLRENMIAKHILAILLLFFLIIVVNPKNVDQNLMKNILITLIVYIWFLFTTRSPLIITLISIILFIILYILNSKKDRLILSNEKDKIKFINSVQYIIIVFLVIISIVGIIIYTLEKRKEYGKDFNLLKFIIGNKNCKNFTPNNAKILPKV